MKILQWLTGKSYQAEQQRIIQELKAENVQLQQQAIWISQAKDRSRSAARRKADYLETAPTAIELLDNQAFKTAYADMVVDIQRQILNSTPEQIDLRESCYLESNTLQKLVLKLDYQVKVARGEQAKMQEALLKAV